mgnify:CR=1 FL=1
MIGYIDPDSGFKGRKVSPVLIKPFYTGSYSCIHLIQQVYVRFMSLYKLFFSQFHRKFSNLHSCLANLNRMSKLPHDSTRAYSCQFDPRFQKYTDQSAWRQTQYGASAQSNASLDPVAPQSRYTPDLATPKSRSAWDSNSYW